VPTGHGHVGKNWTGVKRIIAPNDEAYPMWLLINKCGSTAMAEVLRQVPGGLNGFFHHDYPVHRQVICMWRDPWDRIESTYRMYTQNAVHGWENKSFEEFITHCCTTKELKDPHMQPMYEVATNKYGRFVPDRVLRWDWSEVQRLYGVKPKVHNHTPGDAQAWLPEWRDSYQERYALDFEVWNQCLHAQKSSKECGLATRLKSAI
jgi:hypothetical protein